MLGLRMLHVATDRNHAGGSYGDDDTGPRLRWREDLVPLQARREDLVVHQFKRVPTMHVQAGSTHNDNIRPYLFDTEATQSRCGGIANAIEPCAYCAAHNRTPPRNDGHHHRREYGLHNRSNCYRRHRANIRQRRAMRLEDPKMRMYGCIAAGSAGAGLSRLQQLWL